MNLAKLLYYKKLDYQFKFGIIKGLIVPYDDGFYKELNKTIVDTYPVGIDIKYIRPKLGPGKCYDRSLKMFFAIDNSVLVRGSLKYFRLMGDTEGVNHGWVEKDGYVYDPTWLFRFNKDYYYKIFGVEKEYKTTIEEYCNCSAENNELYTKIKNTTKESIKNNMLDKLTLYTIVPLLKGLASGNEDLKRELDEYLESVEYDEEDIRISINEDIARTLKKR